MSLAHPKSDYFIKRILLRAARLPVMYLIVGSVLTALSYIDEIFPLTKWKNLFDITDKAAAVFMALAAATFCYNFIVLLCRHFERRLSDKAFAASLILLSVRKGLRVLFLLVIMTLLINILKPTEFWLQVSNDVLEIAIICSISWMTIQVFYTLEAYFYRSMRRTLGTQIVRMKVLYTKAHIIRNIATVVIVVITIAFILMTFNSFRNIGISLLASAGFITAIIGLSAQKTLFSLFSGLQIVLAQPIKIGDMVVIDKETGIIEEITFTYVTLKLGDRRRLIVPITYFIEKPFENWSHEENSMRSSFHFHVDFMMPIEPLREALATTLKSSLYWDGEAQKLQVSNLNDKTVEIRVQISAANADNLSDLRAEVKERLLGFIRENYPEYFPKVRLNHGAKDAELNDAAQN